MSGFAPTFDEFVDGLIRNTMRDTFVFDNVDREIGKTWREISEILELDCEDESFGIHKAWQTVPYEGYGAKLASFLWTPNVEGNVIQYTDRSPSSFILSAEVHPRHRTELLDSLRSNLSCAISPVHFVDWWVWRSEMTESLDAYRGELIG